MEETGRNKYFYFFYFYFFLILCYYDFEYRNTSPGVWEGGTPSQTLPLPLRRGTPLLKLFPQISPCLMHSFPKFFLVYLSLHIIFPNFILEILFSERNFCVPALMETFLCVKKSFHTFKRNPFFLPFFV